MNKTVNKKLIYVGFSFLHHGNHAGYNQIANYLDYDKKIKCQKEFNFIQKNTWFARIAKKIFGNRLWWVELHLIAMSVIRPNQLIFHLIYGENTYKHLGKFKFGNKIALTLHQPPSFFIDEKQKSFVNSLKLVDKLIVMSAEMETYFKSLFPTKDIKYIPHGIDTTFFKPKDTKKNQIIMVGNWLRDFDFAAKVFQSLISRNVNLTINIITHPNNYFSFSGVNVTLLSDIKDDELLKLYQESKIVFLPLFRFTANNAILEASACGCSVIVATDKNNFLVKNESSVLFVEKEIESVCETIENQLENWTTEKGLKNRDNMIAQFDWHIIARQTKQFLLSNND